LTDPAPGRPGRAWLALVAALALGAVVAWLLPPPAIDWQPARALREPWRWWSAAFVHYSGLHLGANLAGCALVGALGHAARLPGRVAVAWALAWPLTHLGLLLQPELLHYGGLSGVLHAGVAAVAVHLLIAGTLARRRIAIAIALVLAIKLIGEAPWQGALRHPAGWDIAVAPLAHSTGALAGAICAMAVEAWRRWRPNIAR
jgi:rhomboid family GlyGly-CTERM serine protease